MSTDDARRVAADLLREAGDETGARVLERVEVVVSQLRVEASDPGRLAPTQGMFDLLAHLDPAWAAAEVERAHGEALEMESWRGSSIRRFADAEIEIDLLAAWPGHGAG